MSSIKSAQQYKESADSLRRSNQFDAAIENYHKALEIDPSYFNAHANLSLAYADLGNIEQAIHHGREAIRLRPDFAELYSNLGDIFRHSGDLDSALEYLNKAIDLKPELIHAHFNLGMLYGMKEELAKGIRAFEHVVASSTDKAITAKAFIYIGSFLSRQGKHNQSIAAHKKAISINPGDPETGSTYLFTLNSNPEISNDTFIEEHIFWGKQFEAACRENVPNQIRTERNHERLKIGYVSADLRSHSVAFFLEPLLRNHNHNNFEIYCYCNNDIVDDITEHLKTLVDHWRTITGKPDYTVESVIRNDEIDILIDLSGHTSGNRLPVFACKPAPVQATWLGYPATTGLSKMDYRITDVFSDPENKAEKLHSEKLIRLPDGFLCYEGNEHARVTENPPARVNGYVTFGSFNNITKINSHIVERWAEVLKRTPNSRFLLKTSTLTDRVGKSVLLSMFAKHGIDETRIDWYFKLPRIEDHLDLYNKVDIALDTYPYNGTTTTFEALWMGVPVITLTGDRHASRVGASILGILGLDKMVAQSTDQFIDIATEIAKDLNKLSDLKRNLRARLRNSPLCDAEGFAKKMEHAYEDMWLRAMGRKISNK